MDFYTSIDDMPIFNWFKCTGGDVSFVMLKQQEINDEQSEKCKEVFSKLCGQYIDKYGINEGLRELIDLTNEILVHKIDMAITGDRSIKLFIDIKELELQKLKNVEKPKSNSMKIAIEKYLGRHLDMKIITVTEYYDYFEEMKSAAKS